MLKMFQVDAFTDRVFAGNPAAVLILDEWLDDSVMLSIAQENNLSETAFAVPSVASAWNLRWFAPAHEVDFCGHATLATAHVLSTEHGVRGTMTFHTRTGDLRAAQEGDAYRIDIPALAPEPLNTTPRELEGVFAEPPIDVFRNFENIFANLGGEPAVRRFKPDLTRIGRLGKTGLVVTGVGDGMSGAAFVSRYFAPGAGISEDPVTGSTHATLVPYWSSILGNSSGLAFQASPRGGWLDYELVADRVFLRGAAKTFMEATIFPSD